MNDSCFPILGEHSKQLESEDPIEIVVVRFLTLFRGTVKIGGAKHVLDGEETAVVKALEEPLPRTVLVEVVPRYDDSPAYRLEIEAICRSE